MQESEAKSKFGKNKNLKDQTKKSKKKKKNRPNFVFKELLCLRLFTDDFSRTI